jgi:photosystem II stability/assembly factor-like uncharacterized protein
VLKSGDWGETWQAASTGLSPPGLGSGRVFVSPDSAESQFLYLLWSASPPEEPLRLFRSRDGAESWERLRGELPLAATPYELAADGAAFLALDEAAQLIRWSVQERDWLTGTLPLVEQTRFQQLVLSPTFPADQTLFARSETAGILESTDGGRTWSDTGFPLRVSGGMPAALVAGPDVSLFIGTRLGLYRFSAQEGWSLAQGGLLPGAEHSSPLLVEDGSMVVLSGHGTDCPDQCLFLSSDQGRTWEQSAPALPIAVTPDQIRFSPAFGSDRTAFLAPNWGKPWRSQGGDAWQTVGPDSEQGISALHLSPDFGRDGVLFLQLQDTSLWRSTDSGDGWQEIQGPWGDHVPTAVSMGQGYSLGALTFSPAFAQDQALLTHAGETLYRSIDRGSSWTAVLDLGPEPAQAVFSSGYDLDGTLYIQSARRLFRSADRGQQWQTLPVAAWANLDDVRLLVSPTFAQDKVLVAWSFGGKVLQSSDGGQSWQDISAGLPPARIAEVVMSPQYASDRVMFLVPHGPGLFKRVADGRWLPITQTAPGPPP